MKCTIKANGITSCRAIWLASALLIFLGPTHHRAIGIQTSEIVSPNPVIETDPNLVLGFPAVVKVRFTGPVCVPDLSINSIFADLAAVFVSKSDGSTFTIQSIGPEQQFLVQFHGGLVHPQPRWTLIPEGEKRDLIFDLCYLKPRGSAYPNLRQIPPDKYSLYLQFGQGQVHPDDLKRNLHGCRVRLSGMHTKAVPVTLIEPSRKEKEFLQRMKKRYISIHYPRALRQWEIPSEELADVSPTAKRQIGFHLFLSQVLASKTPVGELSVDKLKLIPVPKYLEPEKKAVLLEIEKATDKSGAEKRITDFVKDNPGQGWRFRNVGYDGHFEGGYLRYK
jgi:hypothetical protein